MTKEEIIEMAQRCGLFGIRPYPDGTYSEALEDFAKLVAEKEIEAILDLVDGYAKNNTDLADAIRTRGQE